jgi:hypothetical protein
MAIVGSFSHDDGRHTSFFERMGLAHTNRMDELLYELSNGKMRSPQGAIEYFETTIKGRKAYVIFPAIQLGVPEDRPSTREFFDSLNCEWEKQEEDPYKGIFECLEDHATSAVPGRKRARRDGVKPDRGGAHEEEEDEEEEGVDEEERGKKDSEEEQQRLRDQHSSEQPAGSGAMGMSDRKTAEEDSHEEDNSRVYGPPTPRIEEEEEDEEEEEEEHEKVQYGPKNHPSDFEPDTSDDDSEETDGEAGGGSEETGAANNSEESDGDGGGGPKPFVRRRLRGKQPNPHECQNAIPWRERPLAQRLRPATSLRPRSPAFNAAQAVKNFKKSDSANHRYTKREWAKELKKREDLAEKLKKEEMEEKKKQRKEKMEAREAARTAKREEADVAHAD